MMYYIPYFFLIINFALAQNINEELKLIDVKVEGNTLTSKNTIIFTSGLHKGEVVKISDFPRAIKKVMATWSFSRYSNFL